MKRSNPVRRALDNHRKQRKLARVSRTARKRPKAARGEAEFKARAADELNREQLHRAIRAGNAAMAAARAERETALALIRERCGRAKERLQTQCSGRRDRTRAEARARIKAAKQDKRDAHAIARAYRGGPKKAKRRRIEAIQESDSAVEAEIMSEAPELLPVWRKVKGGIRGTAHKSRAEAFFEYAEENAGEVAAMLADELPSDQEYAAEYAAWAASQ